MEIDIAECSLAELVQDPLIGLVMKSDGVDHCDLESLLERVARGWARVTDETEVPVSREVARC
jgi:hypothetical protein